MKYILLTQGKRTIVDDKDFEWLNQWKWYYKKDRLGGYAVRHDPDNHNKAIYMHRLIHNTPDGYLTDHHNRNKLDNRRSNLETSTGSKNALNTDIRTSNTSGYKGVCWRKDINKWQSRIMISGNSVHLGLFENITEAIKVRKLAEVNNGL